jgi:hypothetical protein
MSNGYISGEFIGTDFNYLYSEGLRKEIDDNCLESSKSLMTFDEYQDPLNSDW